MNGMWIGSKRNNVKVASRKRITKLINAQADRDRKATVTMQKQSISQTIPNSRENPQLQFFAPNPKGPTPQPVPIMQDKDEEEEEQEIRQSQRIRKQQPIQVQSPQGAASISKNAVYLVLGNAFLADLPQFVPRVLQNSKLAFTPPPDIEEQCNGVVHPVTNKTITKKNDR